MRSMTLLLCAALTLGACSRIAESRINPLNWFGQGTVSAPRDATGAIRPLVSPEQRQQVVDGRVLVSVVNGIDIARTPDGAIVTATGMAPTGAFNAQLVPIAQDGGTLTLAFRVEQLANAGGAQSVTAARFFENAALASVRRIVVQGQQNTATSSR